MRTLWQDIRFAARMLGKNSGFTAIAVLTLALGEEQASKLFALMHEDEIRLISASMAQLGAVPAAVLPLPL